MHEDQEAASQRPEEQSRAAGDFSSQKQDHGSYQDRPSRFWRSGRKRGFVNAHWYSTLLVLWLIEPVLGQSNPHKMLNDAQVLESRGNFATAAEYANLALNSGKLSGAELGKGYMILGLASQGRGDFIGAQIAFEHSVRILKHDREHVQDYAAALENYGGLYLQLGQLDVAVPMCRKALRLRQKIGERTGTALSLMKLAQLALAQNRVREAHKYLQQASDQIQSSTDLTDDDRAFFVETQGSLAMAEHKASAAIPLYQHALALTKQCRGEQYWLVGWEYVLLGYANVESGDSSVALADMRKGLDILDHGLGKGNPKYLVAELAYARVLDRIGLRVEAAQVRRTVERARKDHSGNQCAGCTISVAAFQ
jgi:tetratricopeptide (TPR) repeat protein